MFHIAGGILLAWFIYEVCKFGMQIIAAICESKS
jgi:hypothetical protein